MRPCVDGMQCMLREIRLSDDEGRPTANFSRPSILRVITVNVNAGFRHPPHEVGAAQGHLCN